MAFKLKNGVCRSFGFGVDLRHLSKHPHPKSQVEISETVTDSSARVVTGVQIKISNITTGVTREVTTNEEGVYSAPNLQPGASEIVFWPDRLRGGEARRRIELTVGAAVVLDLALKVGELHESVVVQSEVPADQVSTSDLSAVLNETTVRELRLNGRSWTDLAQLQPGVSAIHTQPDSATRSRESWVGAAVDYFRRAASAEQLSIGWCQRIQNDYANGAPGSVLGGSLGVDAIQGFSAITSNYSKVPAEHGGSRQRHYPDPGQIESTEASELHSEQCA